MTGDVGDPMEAEFDTMAEWTAQVAADLGPEYLVPAACRGSGQPAALDWLLAGLRPGPGDPMIDVGAGTGGPAAYAAGRTGARPVLVEPEPDACRAAARLFDAPVIRVDGTALPFADGAVGLAWSLGVLCTAPGHDAQLASARTMEEQGIRPVAEQMAARLFGPEPSPELTARIMAMMLATSPAGAAAAIRGRAERPDYQPVLKSLNAPALVCAGDRDSYPPRRSPPSWPAACPAPRSSCWTASVICPTSSGRTPSTSTCCASSPVPSRTLAPCGPR